MAKSTVFVASQIPVLKSTSLTLSRPPRAALARLLAPLHLKLGTEGNEDRVPFYTSADFFSGRLSFQNRGFFVGNVQGYDAILGLPFIEDAQILVGNGRVRCVSSKPPPPSDLVSDLGTLGELILPHSVIPIGR